MNAQLHSDLRSAYKALARENRDLTDSIKYAYTIQQGMLPKRRHFQRIWPQTVIFYRPRNIVSGDFFYIVENEGTVFWSVVDCSGHGVPGAMLTMLAHSFLNYAILNKGITDVGDILNEMDKKMLESFRFAQGTHLLDISLLAYSRASRKLTYAGARRKLMVIRNSCADIYIGDNYPVGGLNLEKLRSFTTHNVDISSGEIIYVGSDGYQDQFGGPRNKKFTSKRLHEFLLDIKEYDLHFQRILLLKKFDEWRGKNDQVDDVCLMGIQF